MLTISLGITVSQEEGWGLRGQENLSPSLRNFGNPEEDQESQEVQLNMGGTAQRESQDQDGEDLGKQPLLQEAQDLDSSGCHL